MIAVLIYQNYIAQVLQACLSILLRCPAETAEHAMLSCESDTEPCVFCIYILYYIGYARHKTLQIAQVELASCPGFE